MGRKKITTEEWIRRAKLTHDDRYDYSRVIYTGTHNKVEIICKKHGPFKMEAGEFINRPNECPKCASEGRRIPFDVLVLRANKTHNNKYTYREDKTDTNFIYVTCPIHGEFRQNKFSHINGCGCPQCAEDRRGNAKYTQDELNERFIKSARAVHGDTYDYSQSVYRNSQEPITIVCRKHGQFKTTPSSHIHSLTGCNECAKEALRSKFSATREHFLNRARSAHGDKYEYGEFNGMRKKIKITCPKHGVFEQMADLHCRGEGCPKCKRSLLEESVDRALSKSLTSFETQKRFPWLGLLSIDFYIPDKRIAIECQGEQHYRPIELFGGEKMFSVTQKNDRKKQRLCAKHGITLLYFTKYTKKVDNVRTFNDIDTLLSTINMENDIVSALKRHNAEVHIDDDGNIHSGNTIIKVIRCIEYQRDTLKKNLNNAIKDKKRLVQVYDYEWLTKKDIILPKLLNILGKTQSTPMNARDCTVRLASRVEAQVFFNANHMQGYGYSTLTLCGEINGKTIGMMSFKRLSKNGDKWELVRFACDKNIRCRGMAGKLFKHFIRNYDAHSVKTFADLRWSHPNANMYTKIGFKADATTPCDYMYAGMDGIPRHKFGFRKGKLSKEYGFNRDATEAEMCEELGLTRIWNCGLIRYKWKK